eukprot:TRINITY_DN4266_c0_g1_i5.p1 TRINITY_DN4266_c0_g1~~TRINITY_DN4266_c0_g1_i5.p1  ORF type:complete len:351 (+),score=76.37 TRINITY_DN4266_c0_g1_i5:65-1117(+)
MCIRDRYRMFAVFEPLYNVLMPKFRDEHEALSSLLALASNLCVGSPAFRRDFLGLIDRALRDFEEVFRPTASKFLRLQRQICSLLANLLNEASFQERLLREQTLLTLIAVKLDLTFDTKEKIVSKRYISFVECIFALFANLTVIIIENPGRLSLFEGYRLPQRLLPILSMDKSDAKYTTILQRGLSIISRVIADQPELITADAFKLFANFIDESCQKNGLLGHAQRILIKFLAKRNCERIAQFESQIPEAMQKIQTELVRMINTETDETIYSNGCTLGCSIVDFSIEYALGLRGVIQNLINKVKDKTGSVRKNSGLLLARLAKHPALIEEIRSLHGIELLMSLSAQLLDK